jgi:hypothetical protein
MRARRMVRTALVALVVLLALAGAADARVPTGFFGVTYDREITAAPAPVQAQQWARMRANGIQSVRVIFDWSVAQPSENGPIGFRRTDVTVERAARRGLILLPCVLYAPAWARTDAGSGAAPPKDPARYADYLRALVARYGPRGTFWTEHPGVPKRPIRDWQIWNEPSLRFQWDAPNWAKGYGALLRAADDALNAADGGSRTVMAGLPNRSWQDLSRLYRDGAIKGHFDVAAFHPYTDRPEFVVRIARYVRNVLRSHGDAAKTAWITEFSLPASYKRTDSLNTLQTNDVGMARFLLNTYVALARYGPRRDVRVSRAYWYSWATTYRGQSIFEYSGLNRFTGSKLNRRLALGYYRIAVRRLR